MDLIKECSIESKKLKLFSCHSHIGSKFGSKFYCQKILHRCKVSFSFRQSQQIGVSNEDNIKKPILAAIPELLMRMSAKGLDMQMFYPP
jgi:hypothetical protein